MQARRTVTLALGFMALLVAGHSLAQDPTTVRGDPGAPEPEVRKRTLPAFSEEREAAARFLARKHLPELDMILERLKRADPKAYQEEIREIFQVSEWLSELKSVDERRHQLELDLWKKEMQANLLVAKLARIPANDREGLRVEVQDLVKEMIDLEIAVLRYRVEELEKELSDAREELQRGEDQREDLAKERIDKLWNQATRKSAGR